MSLRKSSNSRAVQPEVITGDREIDSNKPKFKDFNAKGEKAPTASPLAMLGDLAQGLMQIALDKNLWMIAGYGFAGMSVAVSMVGYSRWLAPVMAQSLTIAGIPVGLGVGIITGCAIALFIQWKQIEPVIYKLDPDLADALAFKLGLQRFTNPKETPDSPTLLPKAKAWARRAHDKADRESETMRYALYFLESAFAFATFPLILNGVLHIPGLIAAAMAIGGCEMGYRFGIQAQKKRLTARESQKYRVQKRILRSQAESK